MVKFFEGQDIQFRLGSLAMMRSVGFCDFIFESALQQDLSVSGLAGNLTLMGIADDPVVKNSLIQGLALTFPSLYDGSQRNISAILEAFNLECASLRLSEEETDLCDALSYQYYNVAGYQRCENSS